MEETTQDVLRRLGACHSACVWARDYPDPAAALAACPHRVWLYWLAYRLQDRGHLARPALALAAIALARRVDEPTRETGIAVALDRLETAVRRADDAAIRQAAEYLDALGLNESTPSRRAFADAAWTAVGGTDAVFTLQSGAERPSRWAREFGRSHAGAKVADFDAYRAALGPHLLAAFRAYAEATR